MGITSLSLILQFSAICQILSYNVWLILWSNWLIMMHHMINEIAYLSFSKHKIALKSYAYKTWVHIFTFLLRAIKFCLSYVYRAAWLLKTTFVFLSQWLLIRLGYLNISIGTLQNHHITMYYVYDANVLAFK